MQSYEKEFLDFAIDIGVLRFGEFTLKSGRVSPYFFNSGLFNTGASLARSIASSVLSSCVFRTFNLVSFSSAASSISSRSTAKEKEQSRRNTTTRDAWLAILTSWLAFQGMSWRIQCFGKPSTAGAAARTGCEQRLDEKSTFWFNPKTPPKLAIPSTTSRRSSTAGKLFNL